MNIKILILGCNGFFGKNLKLLLTNKEYILYYLDRQTVDIQNLCQLNDVFVTFKPDIVINCSGLIGSSESNKELDQLFILNTNIIININVLTCCKNNNVKTLIMFSTYRIFLNNIQDNYDECALNNLDFTTTKHNNGGYLLSKKIMHLQIDLFKQSSNVNIVCFILPNIFGPYDTFSTNGRIVPAVINKINIARQENKSLIIHSNENLELNIIYINDIVDIIHNCIQQNNINDNIIVFDKDAVISLKELCNILAKKMNYYNDIVFLNNNSYQDKLCLPNTDKFNTYFKEFKFTDLNKSLQETINFYLS